MQRMRRHTWRLQMSPQSLAETTRTPGATPQNVPDAASRPTQEWHSQPQSCWRFRHDDMTRFDGEETPRPCRRAPESPTERPSSISIPPTAVMHHSRLTRRCARWLCRCPRIRYRRPTSGPRSLRTGIGQLWDTSDRHQIVIELLNTSDSPHGQPLSYARDRLNEVERIPPPPQHRPHPPRAHHALQLQRFPPTPTRPDPYLLHARPALA